MLNCFSWNLGPSYLSNASPCWCLSGHCGNTTEKYQEHFHDCVLRNPSWRGCCFLQKKHLMTLAKIVMEGHWCSSAIFLYLSAKLTRKIFLDSIYGSNLRMSRQDDTLLTPLLVCLSLSSGPHSDFWFQTSHGIRVRHQFRWNSFCRLFWFCFPWRKPAWINTSKICPGKKLSFDSTCEFKSKHKKDQGLHTWL